jgi:UDP-2,3-diacylglucosamine pyrophosphatase LpxH
MWQINDVIVLSDIHLARRKGGAGGKDQALFQADDALVQCLTWIHSEIKASLIVLNGDVFDFLAISPDRAVKTQVTDFSDLAERTTAIIDSHPEVFDALTRLASSSHHELVIVGGNHDPELIFPAVQRVVEKRLSNSLKAGPLRWCVQGEALSLQVGEAGVLIEHGDVLDAWNRIDRSGLRSAVSLCSRGLLSHHRYKPPPGSQLVVDYLISLKQEYPWVDLLKPEKSTVPYLLWYYLPKARLAEFKDALFYYIQAATNHVIVELSEALEPQQLFMASADKLAAAESDSTLGYFQKLWNELNRHGTAIRKKNLISRLREAASNDGFFDISKSEPGNYRALSFLVRNGADLLIHGHTHSAKAYKVAANNAGRQHDGLYLNSGTWARMLRLPTHDEPDAVWEQFVDDLKGGDHVGFAKGFERLTFAQVGLDGNQTRARLKEWTGAPIDLALHRFEPPHQTWTRES